MNAKSLIILLKIVKIIFNERKKMTQETWNAFLKTMNNDPNTIVLDLTKKESTEKEKLVNKFDDLFYKLGEKDIDVQNKYLRDLLRLAPEQILKDLIKKMGAEK